jgi:hypothetical protein
MLPFSLPNHVHLRSAVKQQQQKYQEKMRLGCNKKRLSLLGKKKG